MSIPISAPNDFEDDEPIEDNDEVKSSATVDKMISEMTEEQRKRFDIFRYACVFPQKCIKEMMEKAVPGVKISRDSITIASSATRLFTAELIELARDLSGGTAPLTPDLIMIAFNEIVEKGTVPGMGPGIKRPQVF